MFGSKKSELKALVSSLQDRIKSLEEDKKFLQQQVEQLKDALILREAPQVYYESKKPAKNPISLEQEKREKLLNYTQMIASELEQPLFRDADDMIQHLQKVIGFPGVNDTIRSDES